MACLRMFSRIAPPDLDIKEPWTGDLYGRKAIADQFCELLKTTTQSTTIGISAPYGFGKTFFLTRLKEQIKSGGGWVVYVNAWEYDYLENPLLAVLDSLKTALAEIGDKKKSKAALADLAKSAAPVLAKVAVKRSLGVILGESGVQDIVDAAGDATKESVEKTLAKILKENPAQEVIQSLREKIATLVGENLQKNSNYKSLIVLVDELDRARPNYSVSFMESVKHLLGAAGIVLVVGCDREVFISSAKHQFGQDLPVDGYIRRLFDYWMELPPPGPAKYFDYCAGKLNILSDGLATKDTDIDSAWSSYVEFFGFGCMGRYPSLRVVEQSASQLNVYLRTTPADHWKYIAAAGFLQGLRNTNPLLFEKYLRSPNIKDRVSAAGEIAASNPGIREWAVHWFIAWTHNRPREGGQFAKELLNWAGQGDENISFLQQLLSDRIFRHVENVSIAAQVDTRLRAIANIVSA